ncbi:MAG: hypothetical protein ABI417_05420 [Coleofasciculaceae cyanobacterium]|jgi:hypothetical protein
MIKTNIWVVFCLYLIYVYNSAQLFLTTSGGWMAVFAYIFVGGLFYIVSSALLFFSAAFRTTKRRTKVKINSRFFFRIVAIQAFIVLFNFNMCGEMMCSQGFLPSYLEDISIPVLFSPPFVVVLLALLFYIGLLTFFLLDLS